MGVDQKSGGHDGQKDPAVGLVEAARRPDQRFLAAPLLDGGHGYLSLFWRRLARSSCAFAALVVWTWRKRRVSWSGAIASPRSGGSSVFMSSIWMPARPVNMCICRSCEKTYLSAVSTR